MVALFLPGKKSDHSTAFFTVPLFLPCVRFFYLHFFGIVGVKKFTEQRTNAHIQPHVHTTLCPLCVLLLKFADMTLTLLIKFANMFEKSIFLKNLAVYFWRKFSPG